MAITDIIISVILTAKLKKDQHGFNWRTDKLLGRLLSLSLTSAALTSITAILTAILYVRTSQHNNAYLSFANLLPSLFALSTVYTLNIRDSLREMWSHSHSHSLTTSQTNHTRKTTFALASRLSRPAVHQPSNSGIQVHVSTLRDQDFHEKDDLDPVDSIHLKQVSPRPPSPSGQV
ncbi:hypothetical protein BT69DRAFT_1284779 [Atractiella rhizophila]|nr:hypothetical protein BT69DRAFT_1284779 [Atractiella rhizophila]